jgi:Ca-activated chloride channel family protein
MKSHHVSVTVTNGFAKTEVDQVFVNHGSKDVEAVYSFPIPHKASLSELSLWINGKEVMGEVVAKEKARKLYDEQKQKGNRTALAEQDEYKTFNINVYPVIAGQDTRVRLVYYQALNVDLNVGRYVYPLAEGGVDEERIAFWTSDDEVTGSFSYSMQIKSAFPVKDVRLPHHPQASIAKKPSEQGHIIDISLTTEGGAHLDKDIVVYYRLDPNVPARVELIPFKEKGQSEGTFMAVITPGASLKPIANGTDWTFVLDKSGSMDGEKIRKLCDAVSKTINRLRTQDRFRIITFNERAKDETQGFRTVTHQHVSEALNLVSSIQADGSTNLHDGLSMGLSGLDADRTQGIILVTDGVTNTGLIDHSEFMKLIAKTDTRLFTFIMGNSANKPLLEDLARESNGFALNVSESDDIVGRIMAAQAKVTYQNMRKVSLKVDGVKAFDITPLSLPSLYQGRQLVVFGKYKNPGKAKLTFTATVEGQEKSWHCNAPFPNEDLENPEIERLWAFARIDEMMAKIRRNGEKPDARAKVENLAVEYSLVTPYTSMLVLTEEERTRLGLKARNAQRVKRERAAQQARQDQSAVSRRVDNKKGGMFRGLRAPDIGTGPVGPLFVLMAWLMGRGRRKSRSSSDKQNSNCKKA